MSKFLAEFEVVGPIDLLPCYRVLIGVEKHADYISAQNLLNNYVHGQKE